MNSTLVPTSVLRVETLACETSGSLEQENGTAREMQDSDHKHLTEY